jgi:hypothetical protein
MIGFGNVKKEHLIGAVAGVGAVAVTYYLYKKNQNKIDDFLRKQGINVKSSNQTSYENMSLEELVTVKENLEDLIAEKELGADVNNAVISKE